MSDDRVDVALNHLVQGKTGKKGQGAPEHRTPCGPPCQGDKYRRFGQPQGFILKGCPYGFPLLFVMDSLVCTS